MLTGLAVIAILLYSATSALYISDLFGEAERTRTLSTVGMRAAVGVTVVLMVTAAIDQGTAELMSLTHVFGVIALVNGVGFVLMEEQFNVRGAGAFVAPSSGGLLFAYLLLQSTGSDGGQASLLLAAHVGLAATGLGAFVLAAFLAVLYLVQERQLRERNFGKLFRRLPSLQELEAANIRLVALGFVVYTVAVVLGFVWAARAHGDAFNARSMLAIVAWFIFAAVLVTRVRQGWRGRQSALMTVLGCASATIVLVMYGLG